MSVAGGGWKGHLANIPKATQLLGQRGDLLRLSSRQASRTAGCVSVAPHAHQAGASHCFGTTHIGFIFQKRKWLLLAKYETWGGPDLSGGLSAGTFQVLLPSDSCTLLLRPVVPRELLLPCSFPLLPADLPEAALAKMEVNDENPGCEGKGHPDPTPPLPSPGH